MVLASIIIFFILTIGLSFIIDFFIEWKADLFEQFIIRIGIGLTLIPIMGIIFNILHIPLDWKIFLAITIILPIITIKKSTILEQIKKITFKKITKKQIYYLLITIMFIITAYMYIHGSFLNLHFEDSDPWEYAYVAKYIAEEKTFSADFYFNHFSEPYPQGYSILMGLLHQTNDSIYWNMKFFHNLIISFSILFFFFFVKKLNKNSNIAIISTFTLFAVPAWFSHFIFSLTFNMTIMFILFYSLIQMQKNKKWKYLAIISFASIWIIHFYTAMVITALFILYYLIKVFTQETFNKNLVQVGFFGILLSFIIFWIPGIYKYRETIFHSDHPPQLGGLDMFFPTIEKILANTTYSITFIALIAIIFAIYFLRKKWFPYIKKILQIKNIKWKIFLGILIIALLVLIIPSGKIMYAKGSATRHYTLGDFFIAKGQNMINNPVGIGLILMSLFVIGMIFLIINYKRLFKKENFWIALTFTWSIFTFIGVLGYDFSIGFVPFRMWTFFVIPLSIIVGFIMVNIFKITKYFKGTLKYVILIGLIILFISSVYATSFKQKYTVNTASWPEHKIMIPTSQELFVWLRDSGEIKKWTKVSALCHNPFVVFGYDMYSPGWESKEITYYYDNFLNSTTEENYKFLKKYDYKYAIIDGGCITKFERDPKKINQKIIEFVNSTNFNLVKNTDSAFIFRVQ